MTAIRILIYTDYEEINENEDLYGWGITELRKFIGYKTRGIADFKVDLQYRFASKSQPQGLTRDFLSQYEELWVLCFNTVRMPPYELDKTEVAALNDWMDNGGGLMVAGDHAAGFCDIDHPDIFETLGRSLGEPMKRAGQLRVWQGPPTACTDKPLKDRDNFNTCEGKVPEQLDDIMSQSDGSALKLLRLRGSPHRLFWWGKDTRGGVTSIVRFPDHPHEGKLIIPSELDSDWPSTSPPPVVAAKARDKRFPNEKRDYALVIAYDGDPKVGRIVADSSFHHYININLSGLPSRDSNGYPRPNSVLDQVAQFYGNLALWLTPRDLREKIKLDLFFQLATHPDVFEIRGSGIENLGKVGLYALGLKMDNADLNRLVALSEFETAAKAVDKLLAAILLGSAPSVDLSAAEQTTILGAIIEAHHNYFAERGAITPGWLQEKPNSLGMIRKGIELATEKRPSLGVKLSPLLKQTLRERNGDDSLIN